MYVCETSQVLMTQRGQQKRNPKDYINVTVDRSHYEEISKYLEEVGGEFHTAHMGKFYDTSAMKEYKRMKDRNSLFSRFNTQTLISNGWKKISGSKYQRGEDVVDYTGTFWLHNGERLTEDNYAEKIYNKSMARVNSNVPIKK